MKLDHAFHATTPNEGYGQRAYSANYLPTYSNVEKILRGYVAPYDQKVLNSPDVQIVSIIVRDEKIYYLISRIRENMDEFGRDAITTHIVEIPVNVLNEISLKAVDEAVRVFDSSPVPIGIMPQLEVSESKPEMFLTRAVAQQILSTLSQKSKVYIKQKNQSERTKLAWSIALVLAKSHQDAIIVSDNPLPMLLNNLPTVVISEVMPRLDVTLPWKVVRLSSEPESDEKELPSDLFPLSQEEKEIENWKGEVEQSLGLQFKQTLSPNQKRILADVLLRQGKTDMDHVVPKSWAPDHSLINDPSNLKPLDFHENRSWGNHLFRSRSE